MKIRIYFEPRDIWLGVFWDRRPELNVWVCLLPMLPIHVRFGKQ